MADTPTPPEGPDPGDDLGGSEFSGDHPDEEPVPVVEVDE